VTGDPEGEVPFVQSHTREFPGDCDTSFGFLTDAQRRYVQPE